MNVYIMYKFDDYDGIKDKIHLLEGIDGINVFYFSPDMKSYRRWKVKAKEKMESADAVCYFFNYKTAQHDCRNLKWEYDLAVKYNKKIIIIDNNETNILEEIAKSTKKNNFFKSIFNYEYNDKNINDKTLSFEKSKDKLVEQSSWNLENKLLIQDESDIDKVTKSNYYSLLMEQYKIMVETSEKLMERRQATSNLYTTVCTALVALVGSAFALENMFALSVIFFCVGLVGIILATNWRHSLDSYDKNNEGKFAVLNEIEKKLPANMFDSEYKYNKFKGIKSFSIREKMLPSVFKMLGFVFLICSVLFFVLKCINIDFFIS